MPSHPSESAADRGTNLTAVASTVLPVAIIALAAILAIQGLGDFGLSSIANVRQRQSARAAEQARRLEFTIGQLRQATATLAPDNPRLRILIYQAETTARGMTDNGNEAGRQSELLDARASLAIGLIAELFLLATLTSVYLARREAGAQTAEAPPVRIVTPPPPGPTPPPPSEPDELRQAA